MMILEIAKRGLIPWLVDSSGNVLTATAVSATCGEEMFRKCLLQNIIFFTLIKLNILPPTHFLYPISFMKMSKKSPSKHHFLHLDKTKHDDF